MNQLNPIAINFWVFGTALGSIIVNNSNMTFGAMCGLAIASGFSLVLAFFIK